jgi:hypothetical protein
MTDPTDPGTPGKSVPNPPRPGGGDRPRPQPQGGGGPAAPSSAGGGAAPASSSPPDGGSPSAAPASGDGGSGGGGGGGSGGGGSNESARAASGVLDDPPHHLAQPIPVRIESLPPLPGSYGAGHAGVQLHRSGAVDTASLTLWAAILQHSHAVSFNAFEAWVSRVLCQDAAAADDRFDAVVARLREQLHDPTLDTYDLLMKAAEVFLLTQAGVWQLAGGAGQVQAGLSVEHRGAGGQALPLDAPASRDLLRLETQAMTYAELNARLSAYLSGDANNYLETVIRANFDEGDVSVSPFCASYLDPMGPYLLELIWSYWIEQSMLVQGFNAVLLRFQNVRRAETDPLVELELDPLRPLNNFLWGWIQHEYRHLSVARRAYEYNHQYGLVLSGRAVGQLRPVDPRTTFLAAFHNLLRMCWAFYKEDADTTYIADAFPLLNALKDMGLILSQGADNQFRDLPWQARQEMLVQQWLMARPELKEFLSGKPMVAYPENWMSRMDAMRRLQKWGDVSVLHYNDLARFGERILLSIRYGNWLAQADQEVARTWARFWRPEVQGYLYAYQAVTGVDLSDDPPDTRSGDLRYAQPAVLLERRQEAALVLPTARVPELV